MARLKPEPTYENLDYIAPIDYSYLEEKYVPHWVLKSAIRYHHALQGNHPKPWMRNAKPHNDL